MTSDVISSVSTPLATFQLETQTSVFSQKLDCIKLTFVSIFVCFLLSYLGDAKVYMNSILELRSQCNMLAMFSNGTVKSTQIASATTIAPEMNYNPFFQWLRIVAYSAICLTGVFCNLLVILASRKPGMITVSNIFIANLAVADFIVSLVNVPTTVVYGHLHDWPLGAVPCKVTHIPLRDGGICFNRCPGSYRRRTVLAHCSVHET